MGAHDFSTFSRGADARQAYNNAVEDARHEYGHDSYNGSISTTNGFEVAARIPLPIREAERLGYAKLDNVSKWGPCLAYPVAGEKHFKLQTKKVVLDLPTDQSLYEVDLEGQLRKALGLSMGQYVTHFKEIEKKRKWKITPRKTKGKTKTFYKVEGHHGFANRLYDSAAEARAAAVAYAKKLTDAQGSLWSPNEPFEWKITGVVLREDKQPLDIIEGSMNTNRATYEVTVATRKPGNIPVEGWLFVGMAAS